LITQTGFVLLGNREATLASSPEAPVVNFVWSGEAPAISEKGAFQGGIWSGLDDAAFMEQLLILAFEQWNDVPGSFLELTMTRGTPDIDDEDRVHAIVVRKSANQSTAAYAAPNVPDDEDTIIDCDIVISDRKTEAQALMRTIVHEIGHCVGLGHNHTNYNAIMGYSREGQSWRLGADDMAGVIHLYPDPSQDAQLVKELVACGSVGGIHKNPMRSASSWLLLLAPLVILLWRAKFSR